MYNSSITSRDRTTDCAEKYVTTVARDGVQRYVLTKFHVDFTRVYES